jgi:hypothetical protein
MAKKQTRRSISVSRTTYERLKAFCEANNVSMSQFVESRVGDFLNVGEGQPALPAGLTPRPASAIPRPTSIVPREPSPTGSSFAIGAQRASSATPPAAPPVVPMTSQAARFAVEPPPPIIKRSEQPSAPKPAEKRPEQIFTF